MLDARAAPGALGEENDEAIAAGNIVSQQLIALYVPHNLGGDGGRLLGPELVTVPDVIGQAASVRG